MRASIIAVSVALAGSASAFPAIQVEALKRAAESSPQLITEKRAVCTSNSGTGTVPDPALLDCDFNAQAQYVSNTGKYAFVAPGPNDARGVCPGLNAMANHNYIPHNGVATMEQFIEGTNKVFGMGLDLAGFLAVYGGVFDGNIATFSIGGPNPLVTLAGVVTPQGLSGSHNNYENDVSPTRGDLYEYGNDYLARTDQFKQLYNMATTNYNLEVLQQFRSSRFDYSVANNPYFFNGPFTGLFVQPAAFTFIYRFMANKSASAVDGILSQSVLKSFFSMTGPDANGNFTYTPGHETIPNNWYKRAIGSPYSIPFFLADVLQEAALYPKFLDLGGNLGTVNSFFGLDLANLTGGVFSSENLLVGNNLACFVFQGLGQSLPDFVEARYNTAVSAALNALNPVIAAAISDFGCPKLDKIDQSQFNKFPGYVKSQALPSSS